VKLASKLLLSRDRLTNSLLCLTAEFSGRTAEKIPRSRGTARERSEPYNTVSMSGDERMADDVAVTEPLDANRVL
jgi:hypothetical protein